MLPYRVGAGSTATLFSPAGDIVVLRVAGEVDSESFAVLDAALDDVLDRRPDHLIVDLTGLVICNSRSVTAIARTARVATANGTRATIHAPPCTTPIPQHFDRRCTATAARCTAAPCTPSAPPTGPIPWHQTSMRSCASLSPVSTPPHRTASATPALAGRLRIHHDSYRSLLSPLSPKNPARRWRRSE